MERFFWSLEELRRDWSVSLRKPCVEANDANVDSKIPEVIRSTKKISNGMVRSFCHSNRSNRKMWLNMKNATGI